MVTRVKRARRGSDTPPPARTRARTPPGDDLGAAELTRGLGEHLRELRRVRDWSLDDLARASGVSRAALWQIEAQRSNPSLSVLWKIASGLGLPFSQLFAPTAGQVMKQLRAESPALLSKGGRLESRLVSPPGGFLGIELYELRLSARSTHEAEPHRAGTRELVVVLSGSLRLHLGSELHDVGPGDSIEFPADRPHAYENPGHSEARYHDLIVYGR